MSWLDEVLLPGEEVVYEAKKHSHVFMLPVVLIVLFTLIFLGSCATVTQAEDGSVGVPFSILSMVSLALAFGAGKGAINGLSSKRSRIVVTNRRVLRRHGLLTIRQADRPLDQLDDVRITRRFIDRFFGTARVTFRGTGGSAIGGRGIKDADELRRAALGARESLVSSAASQNR